MSCVVCQSFAVLCGQNEATGSSPLAAPPHSHCDGAAGQEHRADGHSYLVGSSAHGDASHAYPEYDHSGDQQVDLSPRKITFAARVVLAWFSPSHASSAAAVSSLAASWQHSWMISDEDRRQYTARQYESLRAECADARGAQHTILQWNQAVSGTLFAAALLAGTSHSGRFVIAAQSIFGLVLPAVLLGGALAWAGEMIRMERTGVYLRSFERASWDSNDSDALKGTSFFIWENLLWSPPKQFYEAGFRKQNTGYVGVAVFYAIMYLGSMIAFCLLSPWWLSVLACVALVSLGGVVMIPSAVQVLSLGGAAPTVTSEDLTIWVKSLADKKSSLAQSVTLQRIQKILRRTAGSTARPRNKSADGR